MKKALIALAIAVCVLTQAVCCISEEITKTEYTLDLVLDESAQALYVRQSVVYTNQTDEPLTHILFSLPANCFRRESTLPYDNQTLEAAFPNGYSPGGAQIHTVTVNGKSAEWAVRGENECFLRVGVSLPRGESCSIAFEYTLLLSENRAFLGVSDTEWRLTGFYPSVCVYEDGDFAANPLTRAGDSHYSNLSDFTFTVTVPADYEVAAGCETAGKRTESGLYATYDFILENAREAALCISRKFHLKTACSASGIPVYAYGQDRSMLKTAAENAARAIDEAEKLLAPFPYPSFTIVQADLAGSARTASGIAILKSGELENSEKTMPRLIAKMYFSGLVHPNPAMEGWLTDGLSEYVSLLLIRAAEGEKAFGKALTDVILPSLQLTIPGGLTPASETYRFQTQAEYETVMRQRAAAALHEIHIAVGDDAFYGTLREYLARYACRQPVSDDFVRCMNFVTGENRADTVYGWLYTIGDYANETLYDYD